MPDDAGRSTAWHSSNLTMVLRWANKFFVDIAVIAQPRQHSLNCSCALPCSGRHRGSRSALRRRSAHGTQQIHEKGPTWHHLGCLPCSRGRRPDLGDVQEADSNRQASHGPDLGCGSRGQGDLRRAMDATGFLDNTIAQSCLITRKAEPRAERWPLWPWHISAQDCFHHLSEQCDAIRAKGQRRLLFAGAPPHMKRQRRRQKHAPQPSIMS